MSIRPGYIGPHWSGGFPVTGSCFRLHNKSCFDFVGCLFAFAAGHAQGLLLYDDQVVLARYTITALNWKNKIAVPYYMIENAYVQYSSIYWTKDMFSELVPYGDFNYNVVLQLRDGKKYIFSVQDAEDCCAEIMAKVEQYANK